MKLNQLNIISSTRAESSISMLMKMNFCYFTKKKEEENNNNAEDLSKEKEIREWADRCKDTLTGGLSRVHILMNQQRTTKCGWEVNVNDRQFLFNKLAHIQRMR